MPRLSGIDIPNEKRIDISLTYIYGIGEKVAHDLLKKAKVDPSIRTKNLTGEELKNIQAAIETLPTEGELRKIIRDNIETLKRIQAYRGVRHSMGLPVRGQRTRTNARTRKGKRKTIGAISKEAATPAAAPVAKAAPAKTTAQK
ncbi:30S ribosomal protein S13 [Candidatus Collierbacteria bacterium RIFOXYB2_FULL_46_14]|uniref:Small ribosomal subunit protein uS13 n=1 Tax=Candidatus Collierbacteria bacterium GW2011_GWA2_46_26 TaxID=1618381 RepID=A0A0G1PJ94_9BACT|nr:MAG: 30S ribosomal protein S13 [Candidatus Collierbacteria bacterium GW2011_GWC2_44_13]KKU32884.1 MAG: 30S ribosomal protein S13 [Candidatus Collierbacteria bacterium GW2011_GWA2_46_26]OGD72863.1 MAG: 30S ribosomal protein S13 [Candidatus Collierbacteria bacterium RIFOXYB2_FULL_46_14]OGD75905.1 MAG: 30S ribosomal protein S13 [Candidatus Collierbacteria bacterium RIFOXYA2_FULL_46_20]OGD77241.1 MAG: 30S ribosomal protein S13 [Candidatus Collierbacteria bacterium RIFOXYC2_FULL_43_15]OGD80531.1